MPPSRSFSDQREPENGERAVATVTTALSSDDKRSETPPGVMTAAGGGASNQHRYDRPRNENRSRSEAISTSLRDGGSGRLGGRLGLAPLGIALGLASSTAGTPEPPRPQCDLPSLSAVSSRTAGSHATTQSDHNHGTGEHERSVRYHHGVWRNRGRWAVRTGRSSCQRRTRRGGAQIASEVCPHPLPIFRSSGRETANEGRIRRSCFGGSARSCAQSAT